MGRRIAFTSVLAAIAAAAAVAVGVLPASAADDPGTISWAVRPVDAPDGTPRAAVENELDPGATVSDSFEVQNLSAGTVTFRLSAADGYYTDTGRFSMLPASETSVDAGLWIDLPAEVTVAADQIATVPFTVSVPDNAEPGDHVAGIAASIVSASTPDSSGSSVGLESRVGFRVATRVTGELSPAAAVTDVTTDYRTSWNPFQPGSLTVGFTVVNSGNARFNATATASVLGNTVAYVAPDGQPYQELLPGEQRRMEIVVDAVWPIFLLPGSVVVDPQVVTLSGDAVPTDSVSTDFTAVAIPWSQLLVLLGILLIVGAIVGDRLRTRRRVRRLLDDAREEGRRDALNAPDPQTTGV